MEWSELERRFSSAPREHHQGAKVALLGRQATGLARSIYGLVPDPAAQTQAIRCVERAFKLALREIRRT
jgi:hypothetical protein